MAYCMAQYRNVYINNGKARPCCWYERKELKNKVHQLTDIVDVFHSQEFNAIRENTDPNLVVVGNVKCTRKRAEKVIGNYGMNVK